MLRLQWQHWVAENRNHTVSKLLPERVQLMIHCFFRLLTHFWPLTMTIPLVFSQTHTHTHTHSGHRHTQDTHTHTHSGHRHTQDTHTLRTLTHSGHTHTHTHSGHTHTLRTHTHSGQQSLKWWTDREMKLKEKRVGGFINNGHLSALSCPIHVCGESGWPVRFM